MEVDKFLMLLLLPMKLWRIFGNLRKKRWSLVNPTSIMEVALSRSPFEVKHYKL